MTDFYDKGQNTELLDLKGKVSWCRLVQPNKYEKWSLTIHPDTETLNTVRDLQGDGVKNVIKKDDDNQYFFQLSRPTFIEFRKGVKTLVSPPIVRNADGSSMEGVSIGNGSDAIVTVEVYTHPVPNSDKRAKAIRLYGVTVTDLIKFESTEQPEDKTKGWDTVPKE